MLGKPIRGVMKTVSYLSFLRALRVYYRYEPNMFARLLSLQTARAAFRRDWHDSQSPATACLLSDRVCAALGILNERGIRPDAFAD